MHATWRLDSKNARTRGDGPNSSNYFGRPFTAATSRGRRWRVRKRRPRLASEVPGSECARWVPPRYPASGLKNVRTYGTFQLFGKLFAGVFGSPPIFEGPLEMVVSQFGLYRNDRPAMKMGTELSDLLFSAISGALMGFLLDFLATRIVPAYWGSDLDWRAPAAAAVGAMLYHCFKLMAPRKSENSD